MHFHKTADKYVLVIPLSNIRKLCVGSQLWLEVGLISNNTLLYINVSKIYGSIGKKVLCLDIMIL